ncbi:O-methyltransferase [Pestalotiopsis sp. NC0098]|nr:O-methyltransferase [Pestalotiopsis sp. NC0098]
MSTIQLLAELQRAAEREANGDKHAHLELLKGVQKLQNLVATPTEKMMRIRFQAYQNVCVRIAQEKGILQALVTNGRSTAQELSKATGADELLIVRIMRLLSIIAIVDEVGPSTYQANETTEFSVKKGILGDVKYYTDIVLKICSNMGPIAAASNGEIDAHNFTFGKSMFEYTAENPEYGKAFDDFMTARRAATWDKWFDIFPVREKVKPNDVGDVLLVDVAGGQGYWSQQFRQEFTEYPGRIIVQDQPHVITKLDGIETMAYDFFTPQPIEGAKFYYFKQILHNWDDEKSRSILTNTAAAMNKDSTILINDYVLPEEKVGIRAVYMDIAMLVLLGGIERTESQWKSLVESAGLEIVKIWYADETNEGSEAVIEIRLSGDRQ